MEFLLWSAVILALCSAVASLVVNSRPGSWAHTARAGLNVALGTAFLLSVIYLVFSD